MFRNSFFEREQLPVPIKTTKAKINILFFIFPLLAFKFKKIVKKNGIWLPQLKNSVYLFIH
jgi:hypothetical protein